MFTGLVEETGVVEGLKRSGSGVWLRVGGVSVGERGQSVCVSGVCLTVEDFGDDWFEVFLSRETVEKTYLGDVREGHVVNIERALRASDRLGGHIVQGHVDTTTEITDIRQEGDGWTYEYLIPDGYERYLVEKGSIALDGISLTVASVNSGFSVAVIPETRQITNLSEKSVGDMVNVEVDVIAKYVESLVRD